MWCLYMLYYCPKYSPFFFYFPTGLIVTQVIEFFYERAGDFFPSIYIAIDKLLLLLEVLLRYSRLILYLQLFYVTWSLITPSLCFGYTNKMKLQWFYRKMMLWICYIIIVKFLFLSLSFLILAQVNEFFFEHAQRFCWRLLSVFNTANKILQCGPFQ